MNRRALWIGTASVFGLAVIALIAGSLWLRAYLRSDEFRQLIGAGAGRALDASAEFQPLHWNGASAFSPAFEAEGAPGSYLESLGAQQIRADVAWRAIFGGAWRIEHAEVARAEIAIRTEVEREASEDRPGPEAPPAPKKRGILPDRFELGSLRVQSADARIGAHAKLVRTALELRPEAGGWLLAGTGGQLELARRDALAVESFRLRLQKSAVYLTEANLRAGETGRVAVTGEFGAKDRPFHLRVEWDGVDIRDAVDAAWAASLSGSVGGHADIEGRDGQTPVARGRFTVREARVEGIPALEQIASFTRSPQFRRMPVQEASGAFVSDGETTRLTELVLESRGLMRLEGELTLGEGNRVRGQFEIGVTPQTLQWIPGSQEKVFVTNRGGYLWTTLEVGGTLENPTEDLSARLARAMGETVVDQATDILQNAPEKTREAVGDLIDSILPLFR